MKISRRMLFPFVLSAVAGCASAGTDSVDASITPTDAAATIDAAIADAAPTESDAAMSDASLADAAVLGDGGLGDVCTAAAAQPDNDTCATAIDISAAALAPGGATIAGDTRGYVDSLQPPSACTDDFLLDGADAAYRVTVTAGQTITATVTPEGWDTSIYILSSCATPILAASCLVGADAVAGTGVESVNHTFAAGGTYFVIVDGWNPGVEGCFTLDVIVN